MLPVVQKKVVMHAGGPAEVKHAVGGPAEVVMLSVVQPRW